jgi:hypothetical protein
MFDDFDPMQCGLIFRCVVKVLRLIQNARKIHGKHEDHYSSRIELVDSPYLSSSSGQRRPKKNPLLKTAAIPPKPMEHETRK